MKTNKMVFIFITISSMIMGGLLFVVSQKVSAVGRDIRTVEKIVENEKETLRVLNAEWHYLNRPDRLEKVLSGQNYGFKKMDVLGVGSSEEKSGFSVDSQLNQPVSLRPVPRPSLKPGVSFLPASSGGSLPKVKKEQSFDMLLNGLEGDSGQ